ncbi:MAG: hypothetical protein ACTSVV_02225 [Promethearchaeota archaeon]
MKEFEIELRPMEVLRVKNVIRGNAMEKGIRIKFGDEVGDNLAVPCSTSTGKMNLKILIKDDKDKLQIIDEFINWLKKNWK